MILRRWDITLTVFNTKMTVLILFRYGIDDIAYNIFYKKAHFHSARRYKKKVNSLEPPTQRPRVSRIILSSIISFIWMNIIKRTLFLFFACFLCQANCSTAHPRYRRINVRSAKNLARPSYNRQTGFSNLRNSTYLIFWFLEKIRVPIKDDCRQIEWQTVISTFIEWKASFMIAVEIKIPDTPSSGLGSVTISINYSISYAVYEIEHPRDLWLRHRLWTNINLDHNHDDRPRELCT